jgi:hypothetical protein
MDANKITLSSVLIAIKIKLSKDHKQLYSKI